MVQNAQRTGFVRGQRYESDGFLPDWLQNQLAVVKHDAHRTTRGQFVLTFVALERGVRHFDESGSRKGWQAAAEEKLSQPETKHAGLFAALVSVGARIAEDDQRFAPALVPTNDSVETK